MNFSGGVMNRHSGKGSSENVSEERHLDQKGDVYQWALGNRPSGQLQSSPHVQSQPTKDEPDVREIARMIRGER